MQVIAATGLVSGFVYCDPLPGCPCLTHCGEAESATTHFVVQHRHPAFELMYLTHGQYTWQIGRQQIRQAPGDLLVVFPGQLHQTGRPPETLVGQLWAGVDLNRLGRPGIALARDLIRQQEHLIGNCVEAEPLFRAIVRQVVRARPNRDAVVFACLRAIIEVIQQSRHSTLEEHPVYSYPVAKAIQYMQEHVEGRISMRTLTTVAGCGVSHLSDLFRHEIGRSPMAHHKRLRLEAAGDALRSPDASVASVAARFGFGSSQYLSTCLRHAFGVTPRQWAAGGHTADAAQRRKHHGTR